MKVIHINAPLPDGAWFYDPIAHARLPHSKDHFRAKTGEQHFVGVATLNLIYVAHCQTDDRRQPEGATYVRFNRRRLHREECLTLLRLRGLGSVFRGALDQAADAKILQRPERFVIFAQTVGHSRG